MLVSWYPTVEVSFCGIKNSNLEEVALGSVMPANERCPLPLTGRESIRLFANPTLISEGTIGLSCGGLGRTRPCRLLKSETHGVWQNASMLNAVDYPIVRAKMRVPKFLTRRRRYEVDGSMRMVKFGLAHFGFVSKTGSRLLALARSAAASASPRGGRFVAYWRSARQSFIRFAPGVMLAHNVRMSLSDYSQSPFKPFLYAILAVMFFTGIVSFASGLVFLGVFLWTVFVLVGALFWAGRSHRYPWRYP